MDEVERTFLEVEGLFVDPAIKERLTEVSVVNDLLKEEPTTFEDAVRLTAEFNAWWKVDGYKNKTYKLSGDVYLVGDIADVEYTDVDPASHAAYVNRTFISTGFKMLMSPALVDDQVIISQQIYLSGKVEIPDKKGVAGISIENCVVPINADTFLEMRGMTASKAAAWLEMYDPDTRDMIDELVFNSDNEADALLSLKSAILPSVGETKKEIRKQQRVLEAYIQSLIEFDRYIPYQSVLQGECETFDTDTHQWVSHTFKKPKKKLIIIGYDSPTIEHDPKTGAFTASIQVNVVTDDKKSVIMTRLPIASIQSLEPGRELLEDY